ncbi:MAG: HAMP domain-containing protein [Pseudomonadales bacterium]|nr:HAMP domain-containing protein [Pseudomonadales bacterium]
MAQPLATPLLRLATVTQSIAKGELDQRVEPGLENEKLVIW